MRAATGHYVETDAYGATTKLDTHACGHCGGICFVAARTQPEHRCGLCFEYLCAPCKAKGVCDVRDARFDRLDATEKFLRDRFGQEYMRAEEAMRTHQARVEVALARRRLLRDLGFGD